MFLNSGKKPDNPEEDQVDTGRTPCCPMNMKNKLNWPILVSDLEFFLNSTSNVVSQHTGYLSGRKTESFVFNTPALVSDHCYS